MEQENNNIGICPENGGLIEIGTIPEFKFLGVTFRQRIDFVVNCDQLWWKEIKGPYPGSLIGTKVITKIPMCEKILDECPLISRQYEDGDNDGLNIFSKKPAWQKAK